MSDLSIISSARRRFHDVLLHSVLRADADGVPSNADRHNRSSVSIATGIMEKLGPQSVGVRLAGQSAGSRFEDICKDFLEDTFPRLIHRRPGQWTIAKGTGGHSSLAQFDQYEHLAALEAASKANPQLAAALGSDYLIKPDVVIIRQPEDDETINAGANFVDDVRARLTPLRRVNSPRPILHASVSCKWTIRSDRAQNARSEALNLVRNRKGRLPHVVIVTGEPTPSRIASIALGTGDIDCVYHFALTELREAVAELEFSDAKDMLDTMIDGQATQGYRRSPN